MFKDNYAEYYNDNPDKASTLGEMIEKKKSLSPNTEEESDTISKKRRTTKLIDTITSKLSENVLLSVE